MSEPITHEAAVDTIVEAILDPARDAFARASKRTQLATALLAITAPAKLLEELGGDLAALRRTTPVSATLEVAGGTVELAADQVPLEQQIAAWQAMALRISEEKAAIERRLRGFAERMKGDFVENNDPALIELLAFVSGFLPAEGGV